MVATQDYILNGQGHGPVGSVVARDGFRPDINRPFIDDNGIPSVVLNVGKEYDKESKQMRNKYEKVRFSDLDHMGLYPVVNTTTLRKDEWIMIDQAVMRVARKRLKAWTDLAGSNEIRIDGWSSYTYEWETMSDPGFASVDMDATSDSLADRPQFKLEGVPLPVTHSGFYFTRRAVDVSRKKGQSLSMTMAEACGRRVAETIEQTVIGSIAGIQHGVAANYSTTPKVYGYTNYPNRITKTDMTAPTGSNGSTIVSDWLALREELYNANHFGPFMVYVSTNYDQYLDTDFSSAKGSNTLRQRLMAIDGITDIRRLDYLTTDNTVLMVDMSSDVASAINGMDMTTIQWESNDRSKIGFKVMAIHVPLLKADYDGNCGIAHGTTS